MGQVWPAAAFTDNGHRAFGERPETPGAICFQIRLFGVEQPAAAAFQLEIMGRDKDFTGAEQALLKLTKEVERLIHKLRDLTKS